MPESAVTGPVFEIVHSVLKSRKEYQSFLNGGASSEFSAFLDSVAPELVAAGLPADDVQFAKRFPRSEKAFVRDALKTLVDRGILPSSDYDEDGYHALADEIRAQYDHGPFRTYIYPEESRLLFAIADIVRPKSVVFLGSYYGYWARAALAVIAQHGGRAVLVDPDPNVQDVARRNLKSAGLLDSVELAVTTGQEYLVETEALFDLVVLDAETPRDHPDPQLSGKAVYGPLLQHALPRMTSGAILVCHNYLFEDVANCDYFDGIIVRNKDELGLFLSIAAEEFPNLTECTSTEGVGVGKRTRTLTRSQGEQMQGGSS
jgi:predicted O-methyltransferase YrrM